MKASATPQIAFSLGNPPPQQHTIYVSGEASDNDLSLLLSCTVDAEVTSATLVPQSEAGDETGSLFYLDLSPLALDPDVLETLTASAPGWKAKLFSGADGDFLALSAEGATVQLEAGLPVELSIANFAMAAAPAVSSLQLTTYNVAGVADGGLPDDSYSAVVFAQPPSGNGNLADALAFTFIPDDGVGASMAGAPEIANTLTLILSAVPGAAAAQAGPNTVFKVQPAYATDANGFGALMTAGAGSKISIPPTIGWETSNDDQTDGRAWLLKPPAGGLPTPDGNPVSFTFGPVVTYFQPGPTVLLLEYSDVPGFADGAFAVTVEKQAHVVIDSFSVDPPFSTLSGGSATVTASWVVANATRLTLFVDGDPQDVTGLASQQLTITAPTQLSLLAEGLSPGSVDNRSEAKAIAELKAVIESFSVSPAAIDARDCNPTYRVTLKWNVDTDGQVTLAGSVAGALGSSFGSSGSKALDVTEPQTFTLTAKGGAAATIELAALQLGTPQILTAANCPYCGAFSPTDPIFAVTTTELQSGNGAVELYSAVSGQRLVTVPAGPRPGPPVFSHDGTSLLIPNQDSTVWNYAVSRGANGYALTLLALAKPQIPAAMPTASVAGSNGNIYIQFADMSGGWLVILRSDGTGYRFAETVTIGNMPLACALTPDGNFLYTTEINGAVWCVDLRQSPTVSTSISGVGFYVPTSLSISPDGKLLLVANAPGGDSIVGYPLPDTGGPNRGLNVDPNELVEIITLPGGDYALAVSFGGFALVNYARWTFQPTIASLWSVSATVSPDGRLALAFPPGMESPTFTFALIPLTGPPPARRARASRRRARTDLASTQPGE
ncbi:MAG TPA: hypothetical protein VF645_10190 [Allosphingosinicella sp.]|jgi:WD40 repeat protein